MSSLPWDNDQLLPLQSFPPPAGPLPTDTLGNLYPARPPSSIMGFASPENPQTVDAATEWPYLFMKPIGNSLVHPSNTVTIKENVRSEFIVFPTFSFIRGPGDNGMCTPGTWQRVLCGWDLGSYPTKFADRIWLSVPTAKSTFLDIHNNFVCNQTLTRNPKMAVSLGEGHVSWKSVTPLDTFTTSPSDNEFVPVHRLNSLVDNVDIRFGSTGPFMSQTDLDAIDSTPSFAGFKTKRYDLTIESEPESGNPTAKEIEFVMQPNMPPGSALIAVSGRIYDVPNLNLADQDLYNAPRVDIIAQQGSTEIPHNLMTTTRTHKSPAVRTYSSVVIDGTEKIHVIWKSEDPDGQPLKDGLANIPYVKEVSWRYRPVGGINVVKWTVN